MVAMAMVAMGITMARGLLRPSPATAMAAMGTATARGLLRPSSATATDTATAMAAMGTATARGRLRPSPAMATDMGTATGTDTMVEDAKLQKQHFCDQLRIFSYVLHCQEVEFICEL